VGWGKGAIRESESSLFNRLRRHFRVGAGCDLWGGGADAAGRTVSLRAARRLKDGQNGTPHFAKRNETFRTHVASHWNHYERRIRHFAELFVFKGLAPFSVRCSHVIRFHALAPVFRFAEAARAPSVRGSWIDRSRGASGVSDLGFDFPLWITIAVDSVIRKTMFIF
jgi:hypothetical protein